MWRDAGWVQGTFQTGLLEKSITAQFSSSYCDPLRGLGTQMSEIPFLPRRSSRPNRTIYVTAIIQRHKCYYRDKNQKN